VRIFVVIKAPREGRGENLPGIGSLKGRHAGGESHQKGKVLKKSRPAEGTLLRALAKREKVLSTPGSGV